MLTDGPSGSWFASLALMRGEMTPDVDFGNMDVCKFGQKPTGRSGPVTFAWKSAANNEEKIEHRSMHLAAVKTIVKMQKKRNAARAYGEAVEHVHEAMCMQPVEEVASHEGRRVRRRR